MRRAIIAGMAAILIVAGNVEGKKVAFKVKSESQNIKQSSKSNQSAESEELEMARGSFMVASQCLDCNNGYRLDQIEFSGFEKPRASSVETFFITNNTDRTLSGVTMYIGYYDEAGRQLHKQFIKLSCDIPAGETRQAEIKSWDKQHVFRYEKSAKDRRSSAPFSITIDPVAYYLRY